jgi:hypothetical protein
MPAGHVFLALGETESSDSRRESPKPSEIAMLIEMVIALAAAFSLLALGAWVWYLKNPDWLSSVHRLQDML